jgi:predicted ABC-type ATPase
VARAKAPYRLYVLAGVNGAGKSSIGGARIRSLGTTYYNPDEAARLMRASDSRLSQAEANSLAWHEGRRLLERAIAERLEYAFESTLGASTIPRMLSGAADDGAEIWIWYVGLDSPERHLARVKARVDSGGHDIPEADIRRRWENSRQNLVALMPKLSRLWLYDNSIEADPRRGEAPRPRLLLETNARRLVRPKDLAATPEWAKPIVARALQLATRAAVTKLS